jgi:redox-sensitive bicupin YhaK (pirin superfamily)
MEIITYVLKGSLTHEDSMGHHFQIKAGEFQRMSAGSGIMHSEVNESPTEEVHLIQIWIFPETNELSPSYEQKSFLFLLLRRYFTMSVLLSALYFCCLDLVCTD